MNPAAVPRFYFSFRSPYSWLAYRDLVDRYPGPARRLDWRPFWEPDEWSGRMLAEAGGRFPYVDMSRPKALYILQDVRRLAHGRGLRVVWPVDRAPVWEVAHLAYLVARRHGRGREFIARVYRARWEQGRDISDPATIGDLCAGLGLDPGRVAGAAADPGIRRAGVDALLDVCADGVFGVPFFVYGRERFWGVDRLPDFLAALTARDEPGGAALTAPEEPGWAADPDPGAAGLDGQPAAEQGHAGGCG